LGGGGFGRRRERELSIVAHLSAGGSDTMATATWKDRAFLFPATGLLVLAGTAWAQIDRPLPAGVTPPSDPRAMAGQMKRWRDR